MKTKLCVACLFLMIRLTLQTHADYIELTTPCVAFRTDYPETARTNITVALQRSDCEFLGGSALNSFTSLSYGGDTRALNLFLDGLAKCPGVTLSVSFVSDSLPDDRCDWHVSHAAGQNRFNVRVNLKSSRIKLDKLVIPESKGPPLPEAKK